MSRQIVAAYSVSILASAIRFAELASERCAAVFSAAGKVKWFAPSPAFAHEIERGRVLDRSSLAWDYFKKSSLDDSPQRVHADACLDMSRGAEIVEHTTCSPARFAGFQSPAALDSVMLHDQNYPRPVLAYEDFNSHVEAHLLFALDMAHADGLNVF